MKHFAAPLMSAALALAADVTVVDHAKVEASLMKSGLLHAAENYKIQGSFRKGPGKPEIHKKDTDIFYFVEGSAKLVTGGEVVESKETAANEIRGESIKGGESRTITKGDVVVIPAGVPHWFAEVPGLLKYFVVKVGK